MRILFTVFLLFFSIQGHAFSTNDVFQAVETADLKMLKQFIEKESISPSLMRDGLPLIFYSKDLKTTRYLLSKGAETTNTKKRTLLMQAVALNNTAMIKFFLTKEDVNAKDIEGWTALFYVASVGENSKALQLLTKAGANVQHKDNDGWTALMLAAERGNPKLVALLIKAGSNISTVNKDKKTALMLAKEALPFAVDKPSYEEVVKLLSQGRQ
ncbi:MAG: ankyrin repeat domain-containing protein [Brevinema sp.]